MYLGKWLKICIQLSGLNANFVPSEAYINWRTIYKKNNKTLQMLNEVEPYEHNHRAVFRALEEVLTSEQQWGIVFVNFSINPPLVGTQILFE